MTGNPKQPSPQAVMWSFALPKSVDQLHEHVRREVFRRIHIIGAHSDELVDRRVVMQINLAKRILLTTMRSCKETVFVGNVRQSQEDHVWSDVVLRHSLSYIGICIVEPAFFYAKDGPKCRPKCPPFSAVP